MKKKRGIFNFNRKGASHLEMIFSFVLFILFVTFILLFVRPFGTSSVLSDSLLLGLHDSFEDQTTVNLTKVFLKIEPDDEPKPFNYNQCSDLTLMGNYLYEQGGSSVKNAITGEAVSSFLKTSGNWNSNYHSRSFFIGTEESDPNSLVYYVFLSPDLSQEDYSGCTNGNANTLNFPEDYSIGSVELTEVVSEFELGELKTRYDDDYDGLKLEFGLPSSVDFEILGGPQVLSRNVPEDIEVRAKVYNQNVLMADGTLVNTEFIFRIW
ncbi:hypothetical protein HN865_02700 [Candidatus Woesearchaeota archaeon]|jgi:hypothetical protein|nr:hypothetical protein [Candidatus Woesearchaeota archaeon]